MSSIDESEFMPLNIAVLTISDTRSLEDDKSGTHTVGAAHRGRSQIGGARDRRR